MEIDLSQELVYKIKLPGNKVVELREPTMDDIEVLRGDGTTDPKAQAAGFRAFVKRLGMADEDIDNLGVVRLKTLAEGLMEPLSQKK